MAASLAVRTSFEWSARSRSAWLWCWSVDSLGTILTATCHELVTMLRVAIPRHWYEATYLLPRLSVFRQLDLTHAARADGLTKPP